jgi:hypothetical protein
MHDMLTCGISVGPRNAYKDLLDNVVSPITCVSMNHQNQLEQMANGAMFATIVACATLQRWLKKIVSAFDYYTTFVLLGVLGGQARNT